MRIAIIGCGYLGAVHAVCMAKLGHQVTGFDVDEQRIAALTSGRAPFFEPGFSELLAEHVATGELAFSGDPASVAGSDIHFVCVGTPQVAGADAADLTFVDAAFSALIEHLRDGDIVVGKSTVPVGTAERLAKLIDDSPVDATLVWSPEFLREGFAVRDTLNPNRLVYGVGAGPAGQRAVAVLDRAYAQVIAQGTPRLVVDYATAELVKFAANSFLATKISFINAMAQICEAAGADVATLADAIGMDERIGRCFLNAGLGFGGGCLPKDIRAFMARAGELDAGEALTFLREVDAINIGQRARVVGLAGEICGGSVLGRKIAVLGAAFKPNSDDVRDSPALDVAKQLRDLGADVVVTDPRTAEKAALLMPELKFVFTVNEAAQDADLVLLATEWDEYVRIQPGVLADVVSERRVLDARNALDPVTWRDAGWTYRAVGRP